MLVVPEHAVVDGAIVEEGNLPVALSVAPVGREELLPAPLHRLDALNLESTLAVALNEVERLDALGQRREVERHIATTVLVCLQVLVEFNAVGRGDGIAIIAHLQIGVARKLEPEVGIVRPLMCGDIHHRLVVLQLDLRYVKGEVEEPVAVTSSKLRSGLLPHHIFSLSRLRCEGQHHG